MPTRGPNYRPTNPVARGFVSRVFKFIPMRPQGQWTGRLEVAGTALDLTAVTYDTTQINPTMIAADFAALEAAPDDEVFDMRAALGTTASKWGRNTQARVVLQSSLIDVARLQGTFTLRRTMREVVKNMLVQQSLSRNFYPMDLSSRFDSLPLRAREATADFLVEHGLATPRLPTDSTTLQQLYSDLIDNPPPHWQLDRVDTGGFHLGRREANLGEPRGGGAAPVGGGEVVGRGG